MKNYFLLMGCNELQSPIIDIAKNSGLKIISVDRNCIKEIREKSDFIIQDDLRNFKEISDKIKEINVKRIVGYYGVADYAYESILKIFKRLNLKHKQLAFITKFTNKIKTNELLKKQKIFYPKSKILKETNFDFFKILGNKFSYPIIFKEPSSYNSLGVSEIKNDYELKKFLKEHNYNESIIIQEKIVGKVFNIDLIFFNKNIIKHAYTERFFYKNFKASFSIEYKNNEKFKSYFEYSIQICKKIGINSGPVTLDFIERDGRLYLLEISQHLHSIYLNKISGRLGNIKCWFDSLNNKDIKREFINKTYYHCAYLNIYLNTYHSLQIKLKEIKLLESFFEFRKRRISNLKNSSEYLIGIIFLKNRNISNLKKDINLINHYLNKNN